MSDSDTGETSRSKIKYIDPVTNGLLVTARMLVIARMMIIRPCLLLQYKKLRNTTKEEIKGRWKHHKNLCCQIQGILPRQKNHTEEGNSTKSHRFQIKSKSESYK